MKAIEFLFLALLFVLSNLQSFVHAVSPIRIDQRTPSTSHRSAFVLRDHGGCWGFCSDPSCVGRNSFARILVHQLARGGYQEQEAEAETTATTTADEMTLDEKVQAAMRRLGLTPPSQSQSPTPITTYTQDDGHTSDATYESSSMEQTDESSPTSSSASTSPDVENGAESECQDGICSMPSQPSAAITVTDVPSASSMAMSDNIAATGMQIPFISTDTEPMDDPQTIAQRIANDLQVDVSLAWAALGATSTNVKDDMDRIYNEQAARALVQQELDIIALVSEDSAEVHQLVSEGFDTFLSRRALAFAEGNMDDARAILIADKMDEEEEQEARNEANSSAEESSNAQELPAAFKTVTVSKDFDPTTIMGSPAEAEAEAVPSSSSLPQESSSAEGVGMLPKPAKKENVVFEASAAQIQELVLESPVPVLLDVYADWCGPCKALSPALEEMAIKAGGAFRLVKVNSDNERAVSGALEVTGLPTVFGVRNGTIIHMFTGMPRSQDAIKSFMMGLLVGDNYFSPPVSATEKKKYQELTRKLLKTAGSACFSFSSRERLQDRVAARMDELVQQASGDVSIAEESAQTLRLLLSNVIRDPFNTKFRTVKLNNAVIAAKIERYPASMAILRSCGFVHDKENNIMMLGKGKKIVNVTPLTIARTAIDAWIDRTRYEVAKAARKRKDEIDRNRLLEESEAAAAAARAAGHDDDTGGDSTSEHQDIVDPHSVTLKVRMAGKKKVHNMMMKADDPLRQLVAQLPVAVGEDEEVHITCVAKKLLIKSTDEGCMDKSLRDWGLVPSAALVVSIVSPSTPISSTETVVPLPGATETSEAEDDDDGSAATTATSRLANRAAKKKKKKTGSHTMQSVGIYAKDDNSKAELIDGGGGVWYEHDVTDDENEEETEQLEQKQSKKQAAGPRHGSTKSSPTKKTKRKSVAKTARSLHQDMQPNRSNEIDDDNAANSDDSSDADATNSSYDDDD